jgi:FAD/FMN-containing dehydrogenase
MTDITLKTLEGKEINLSGDALESLGATLRGSVVTPSDPDYDQVRTVWNAMIDRRPGLIVRCAGAADVARCVNFSRDNGLLVSVRGGGHNIGGNSVSDGGLMIDLSAMKSVRVDRRRRTVRLEPGVTLGEVDSETQQYGLALPVGINSTTGVAGLTLGGGFGWLSRKHGLTVDNLISADVVTADGELVHADIENNADLFWGIRGGGGNLGIVTSFEFRLHEVGPEVLAGMIVHPFSAAKDLLYEYRKFVADAPDELTCWVVMRKAPPLPFLSEEVHGTEIIAVAACYLGDMNEGEKLLKPLREFGNPHGDVISPHRLTDWQQAFDPLLTPGARNYWKSHNFTELGDETIEALLRYAGALPSDQSEIFVGHLGGAVNRVAADATAYHHRDAEFVLNVHTRWEERNDDERCIAWARDFYTDTLPHATGGVYVNFMTEEETDRIGPAYGRNYDRLVELKDKYDPANMFRLNQNIKPTV